MTQFFTNNAITVLPSDLSSGAVSFSVQTGFGGLFPSISGPQHYFIVSLENPQYPNLGIEIVLVTARAGDTFTVTRGYEGSGAKSWPAGTLVDHRLTAITLNRWETQIAQRVVNDGGTPSFVSDIFANRPVSGTTGRIFIATDTGVIYRDTGSTWVVIGQTVLYAENPTTASPPIASGDNSVAIMTEAQALAEDSLAIGKQAVARIRGSVVQANDRFATSGDCQHGKYMLKGITNNSLSTELFVDGVGGNTRLVLPDDSTWTFTITITAHRTDASGGHAGFKSTGVIYKEATASSTSIQGTVSTNVIARSNGQWGINITADTVNGSLKITVNGQNGKTIRWAALVETLEVTN